MNIETVNELIWSLESAGELSIREQKFLKLAKAHVQLAAENVQIKAMNDCLSEELRGYESDGAFEGPKMHLLWWQVETPTTDRIVAGIKADGVEEFSKTLEGAADICGKSKAWEAKENLLDFASRGFEFAKQMRHGADK